MRKVLFAIIASMRWMPSCKDSGILRVSQAPGSLWVLRLGCDLACNEQREYQGTDRSVVSEGATPSCSICWNINSSTARCKIISAAQFHSGIAALCTERRKSF